MSDDFLEELFNDQEPEDEGLKPQESTEETTTEEVVEETTTEEEVEEAGETTEETSNPPSHMVPVGALTAERAKAKAEKEAREALERRAQELENQLRYHQAREEAAVRQYQAPSFREDPEGYIQQQAAALAQQQEEHTLRIQYEMAKTQLGDEVDAARQWAMTRIETDPRLQAVWNSSPNRIMALVEEYRNDQFLQSYRNDPQAFVKSEYEKMGLVKSNPVESAPVKTPPKILSDGIASAPSKGVLENTADTDPIANLFKIQS